MISIDQICLLQFAKLPQLGKVKTRMQPALSPQQSLNLHRQLVDYSAQIYSARGFAGYQFWFAGEPETPEQAAWLDNLQQRYGCSLQQQVGGDLGQRMAHAAKQALGQYQAVIIVGSDCPFIDAEKLQQLVQRWQRPMMFIPALDGGYVLIALRQYTDSVFTDIPWGGPEVMERSRQQLQQQGLAWDELDALNDIDVLEDLPTLADIPELAEFSRLSRSASV